MKKACLGSIIVLFFFCKENTQKDFFNPIRKVVIAQDGLRVRTKPNINSKQMGLLPFLKNVSLVNRSRFKL